MRTIRQILLTEYIGAILVAVLVVDALQAIITQAVTQISYHLYLAERFGVKESQGFSPAYSALQALARIALYLTSAYLLARWLYPANQAPTQSGPDSQSEPKGGEEM